MSIYLLLTKKTQSVQWILHVNVEGESHLRFARTLCCAM